MKTFVVDSIYFMVILLWVMLARAEPIRSASSLTRGCSASSRAFFVTGCHSTGAGTGAFILPIHVSNSVQVVRASSNARPRGMRPLAYPLITVRVQAGG